MPTYEYHCPACGATYDLRQSFSAEVTHVCEECGKGTAKRVLHAPPVVFKGSGWYSTDSRSRSSSMTGSGDHGSNDGDSAGSSSDSSKSSASDSSNTSDSSSSESKSKSKGDSAAAAAS